MRTYMQTNKIALSSKQNNRKQVKYEAHARNPSDSPLPPKKKGEGGGGG